MAGVDETMKILVRGMGGDGGGLEKGASVCNPKERELIDLCKVDGGGGGCSDQSTVVSGEL